ncbi:hypothetical protein DMA15_04840 [Streptomyces sp. WAC 01529]|nr:hypothetical protein DMA15_04840 [Streptomyces sp. WAC 01529]
MRHLCERGLTGVRLVIGDYHLGLVKAMRMITGRLCHPGGGYAGRRARSLRTRTAAPRTEGRLRPSTDTATERKTRRAMLTPVASAEVWRDGSGVPQGRERRPRSQWGSGYGGGGGGGGTAPTSSSGRTGESGGSPTFSCDWTGRHCQPKQYARPGPTDSNTGDTIVLGLISNFFHTSEYFGALVDSDCRDVDNCTYGEDCDKWVASKGYDTESDSYLVPGLLAAMFAHNPTK